MHRTALIILAAACVVILLFSLVYRPRLNEPFHAADASPSVVFTCTTFFAKPNKYEQFVNAIDSIDPKDRELVSKWIVVNEFSDEDAATDFASLIHSRFPSLDIEFIQKEQQDRGQARSLNMILDKVRAYDLWVQWEESWVAKGAFLEKAISIMTKNDPRISQLQLTDDWRDVDPKRLDWHVQGYAILKVDPAFHSVPHDPDAHDLLEQWPLFSLRPSVNRTDFADTCGMFDEDPSMWPIRFEYAYGLKWVAAGHVKALIEPPVAERQANHVSTYSTNSS